MNLYKINDVVDSEFLRLPLTFFANPTYKAMSLEAKVIYSLLLNRITLSQRNGWINEENEVYLIYTREEAAETLGISYKKAVAAFKELDELNLILQKRRGQGRANYIYIVKADLSPEDAKEFNEEFDSLQNDNNQQNDDMSNDERKNTDSNRHNKTCPNDTPRYVKTTHQDMSKQHTIKIKSSNTESSNIQSSQDKRLSRKEYIKAIKKQIDFASWEQSGQKQDVELLNAIIGYMADLCFSKRPQIKINKKLLDTELVRNDFLNITLDTLLQVLKIIKCQDDINQPRPYIWTCVYNQIHSDELQDSFPQLALNKQEYDGSHEPPSYNLEELSKRGMNVPEI